MSSSIWYSEPSTMDRNRFSTRTGSSQARRPASTWRNASTITATFIVDAAWNGRSALRRYETAPSGASRWTATATVAPG